MSLTKVTNSMIKDAAVNVVDLGADPTGAIDSTAAFVAAVAKSLNVFVPIGTYIIDTAITLRPGQNIYGVNGGQFSDTSSITNSTVGGGIFWIADGAGAPAQLDGPTISNFTLIADYPIKLNPETATIIDGSSATTPYFMKPKIDNCYIKARSVQVGTGISFSKVFDFIIERCLVHSFDINILLQGCDLGRVLTNRLIGAGSYQILEISTGSFGSQNWIENNDILSSTGVYIKSCSRHSRIKNNYLETAGAIGGIDLTNLGCPQYGANVPATPLTIVCKDNRIDGHADMSSFVYRLDGNNPAVSTLLHDPGTSGPQASAAKTLLIDGGVISLLFNSVKTTVLDIEVPNSDYYTSYSTELVPVSGSSGLKIASENTAHLSGLSAQNAGLYCGLNGADSIVIKPTMTGGNSPLFMYLWAVNDLVAHPLTPGVNYKIYMTARSPSSETLNASYLLGGSGGSLNTVSLIPSYTTFLIATVAAPAAGIKFGVYFTRGTTTDNIFIQSIEFVPV